MDERVLNNVKNKIATYNCEREISMKKNNVLPLAVLTVVLFSIGFGSVNAATNNALVDYIKDKISFVNVDKDGNTTDINGTVYTKEDGSTWIRYENDNNQTDVNVTEAEEENLEVHGKVSEDSTEIEIK